MSKAQYLSYPVFSKILGAAVFSGIALILQILKIPKRSYQVEFSKKAVTKLYSQNL